VRPVDALYPSQSVCHPLAQCDVIGCILYIAQGHRRSWTQRPWQRLLQARKEFRAMQVQSRTRRAGSSNLFARLPKSWYFWIRGEPGPKCPVERLNLDSRCFKILRSSDSRCGRSSQMKLSASMKQFEFRLLSEFRWCHETLHRPHRPCILYPPSPLTALALHHHELFRRFSESDIAFRRRRSACQDTTFDTKRLTMAATLISIVAPAVEFKSRRN